MRETLRAGTADAHRRLEQELDLVRRLDDPRDVLLVLARLHGLFAAAEPVLEASLGREAMAGRSRVGALAADLQAMGLSEGEVEALPRPALMGGGFDGRDEALGALYVLEGTRLGGRIIAREAAGRDWVPADGLAFWRDDPAVGALWAGFLALLDTAGSPPVVVSGANRMFDACLDWLVIRD